MSRPYIGIIAPRSKLCPPMYQGGTELFCTELAEGLTEMGLDVILYCHPESKAKCEKIHQSDVAVVDSDSWNRMDDFVYYTDAIASLAEITDIIHGNNPIGAVLASSFLSTPYVHTLHHPHTVAFERTYAHIGHNSVTYVCISESQKSFYSIGTGWNVIHHGIDFRKYSLSPRKWPSLCFVGRLIQDKGVLEAIQICEANDVRLWIIGGPDKNIDPRLEYYSEVLSGAVNYLGPLSQMEKISTVSHCSAMLFPVQWQEQFGLAMIEAMACGTPVFALSNGSIPEIIDDTITGRIADGIVSLNAIVRDFKDKEFKGFDPATVRTYAQQRFDRSIMCQKYAELYEKIFS